jgi:CHAD domain-containing protein
MTPDKKKKKPIPDVTTQVVAARLILKQVRALEAELPGVEAAEDIEAIHRMRVASRRLRSNLMIFEPVLPAKPLARWQQGVRGLTRALGSARDLDVQIEHVSTTLNHTTDKELQRGLRRLMLRLQQQRANRQKTVLKMVADWQKEKTGADLYLRLGGWESRLPDGKCEPSLPLADLACKSILDHLATFLGYAPCLDDPADIKPLHAMRIAAKWLRYTLESFDTVWNGAFDMQLGILRNAQETLGIIHDCDVWADLIPEFISRETRKTQSYFGHTRPMRHILPGLEYYRQLRADERSSLFEQYRQDWFVWQEQHVWERLREIVLENSRSLRPSQITEADKA